MGNSLRCCLACVLPCGALDLIRIVHLNGRIEEYARPVAAGEILAANPNHVLSKPCSQSQGVAVRRILIVSPDSELERGEIYFLIPAASVPPEKKPQPQQQQQKSVLQKADQLVVKKKASSPVVGCHGNKTAHHPNSNGRRELGDDTLSQSQKRSSSSHRRRRSGGGCRASVWKPHLECIVEDT